MPKLKAWMARLLAAGALAAALGSPAAHAEDFQIGVVASLTGPAAGFFREYVEGFNAYASAWNARGGYNGQKIALVTADDESNAVQAVNGYRRLAGDPKTKLVWAAGPGAGALGIKAIASELKVPVVSGGALDVLGKPAEPYFFKIAPANRDFLTLLIDWMKQKGIKRMAVLAANDAYGQGETAVLREMAGLAGIELSAVESYTVTDTNFLSQLVRVRQSNPQFFYVSGTGAPGILIFKQMKQLNLSMPICMQLAALTNTFFESIGGASQADGILTPGLLGMLGARNVGPAGEQYTILSKVLGKPASLATSLGWDIGIATEDALKKSDGTREGIRAQLDKIVDLPGINGPIKFTPDNHIGQDTRGLAMMKLQGGEYLRAD